MNFQRLGALVTIACALGAGGAVAQDRMPRDGMHTDGMAKDGMKSDPMKK